MPDELAPQWVPPGDQDAPPTPPGVLRRAAEGAWHVLAGFAFLLRNPSLWGLAALPAALALVLIAAGAIAGYFVFPSLESRVLPAPDWIPDVLRFLMMLLLWAATVAAGMAAGLAVALLLSAPVLERLSRNVEVKVRGVAVERAQGLAWEIAQSLLGGTYFLAAVPGMFLLSLVPVLGPFAAAAWGAYALSFQHTEAPLARRGYDFARKRAWHGRWRAESMGFGLAGVVALLTPLANLLVAPALAVGATLLVVELEDAAAAPPAPRPEPAAPVAAD